MLTGMYESTSGEAWIGGRSMTKEMHAIRQHIGTPSPSPLSSFASFAFTTSPPHHRLSLASPLHFTSRSLPLFSIFGWLLTYCAMCNTLISTTPHHTTPHITHHHITSPHHITRHPPHHMITSPHHTTSNHITPSHYTTSHHTTPPHLTSHITSHHTTSPHTTPHHTLPHHNRFMSPILNPLQPTNSGRAFGALRYTERCTQRTAGIRSRNSFRGCETQRPTLNACKCVEWWKQKKIECSHGYVIGVCGCGG